MRFKIDENLPVEFAHVLRCLDRLIPVLEDEPLRGRLWIAEEDRGRIRSSWWALRLLDRKHAHHNGD
jgi:hypothetical protein